MPPPEEQGLNPPVRFRAMMFARSEAIKRRVNVTVAQRDTDPPTGTFDWKNGWTVVATGVAAPLRTQDSLSGVTFSGATSVVYRLDGRLTVGTPVAILIQPQIADSSIQNRCLRVDPTGLPKTTNISTTTCP